MTIPAPGDGSKLVLGTVQLGGVYGIANRTGAPDHSAALGIVAAALEGGITTFDTAASYGISEVVLGQCLEELGATGDVTVITKTLPLSPAELSDPVAARLAIESSVAQSRRRLKLDTIPVVLFHREADMLHLDALLALRDRGWIAHMGVSGDEQPVPLMGFVATAGVDAVQVPGSILDRRHRLGGTFEAAQTNAVTVFVRSIFLQGLLLMPESAIPPALSEVIPARRALAAVSRKIGIALPELAVRYMLALPGDIRPILGAETAEQVRQNVSLAAAGRLGPDEVLAIEDAVGSLPERVVSPRFWT